MPPLLVLVGALSVLTATVELTDVNTAQNAVPSSDDTHNWKDCDSLESADLKSVDMCDGDLSSGLLDVSFTSECDGSVTTQQASAQPRIQYLEADENATYFLAMVDPFAFPQQDHYYLYWAVIFPGRCLGDETCPGNDLKEYVPPSGADRVVQLLLFLDQQPETYKKITRRHHFKLKHFLEKSTICPLKATFQYRVNSLN